MCSSAPCPLPALGRLTAFGWDRLRSIGRAAPGQGCALCRFQLSSGTLCACHLGVLLGNALPLPSCPRRTAQAARALGELCFSVKMGAMCADVLFSNACCSIEMDEDVMW